MTTGFTSSTRAAADAVAREEGLLIEVRFARLQALESVRARKVEFPGDIGDALEWLLMLAVEELSRVKAVLSFEVMSRDKAAPHQGFEVWCGA